METKHSTNPPNEQISELSERMARIETKMDFVANREVSVQC